MQLIAEHQAPEPVPLPTPTTASIPKATPPNVNLKQEFIERSAWKQSVLGALNLAAKVLAVRLILLLAVLGAVALTWLALAASGPLKLAALAVYTVTVIIPLIWLSAR